jgi:hypothetical protein
MSFWLFDDMFNVPNKENDMFGEVKFKIKNKIFTEKISNKNFSQRKFDKKINFIKPFFRFFLLVFCFYLVGNMRIRCLFG